MNSLDFYLALLFGCKRDVARVAVKVGGLTDCVFTGLCGALPEAKREGGGVQEAYSNANSGMWKVVFFLVATMVAIKNMKTYILMLGALCIALLPTAYGNHSNHNDTTDVILLERMERPAHNANSTYTLYEYDAQRRIAKRSVYYYPETLFTEYTVAYNDNEIVLTSFWSSATFVQNGNKITFFEGKNISIEIEINDDGLPVKQISVEAHGNRYWKEKTFIYTWENGNLIQEDWEHYTEEDGIVEFSTGTTIYTYDAMKSPFYYCATPKWFIMYWLGIAHCSNNNVETAYTTQKYSSKRFRSSAEANTPIGATDVGTQRQANTYNDDGFLYTQKNTADETGFRLSFYYTNQNN